MIKIYWNSDNHSLLRCDIYNNWTTTQFVDSVERIQKLRTDFVDTFCGLLIDVRNDKRLPPPRAILLVRDAMADIDFPVAIVPPIEGIAIARSLVTTAFRILDIQRDIQVFRYEEQAIEHLMSYCDTRP